MSATTSMVRQLMRDQLSGEAQEPTSRAKTGSGTTTLSVDEVKTAAKEGAREALAEARDTGSESGKGTGYGESTGESDSGGGMSLLRVLLLGFVAVYLLRRRRGDKNDST